MFGFDFADAVQAAALLALAAISVFALRRIDHRFNQQHDDMQDVIISQHDIIKKLNGQQAEIDRLKSKDRA
jgi:hypothetical protein